MLQSHEIHVRKHGKGTSLWSCEFKVDHSSCLFILLIGIFLLVFSTLTRFISCLHSKQDILSLFEIISGPLLQWLSHQEIKDENAKDQLGILWAESLNCLQRSQPLLTFDSSFLKLQASLLEKTLDHPNTSVSDPTIIFWNSTYGKQISMEYPQNLLHVLHKLSRNGRISLYNRSKSFVARCSTLENDTVTTPWCCKITPTQKSSKRVELTEEGMIPGSNQNNKPPSNSKRKRVELTEHQKEVRRAQQGRERDCNGHGPGVQTYTSLDFSQGNQESQDSQDIRDSEAMLEMLRRVG
ncbi:Armadillo-type [Gossypium australe]|uniref:Armadillo-type n=1 Tax=Gossypium australe TaxID=47621 RepID=A0A5B6WVV3_9ROSI|nr:Armadillo-type [Gossypium australe]